MQKQRLRSTSSVDWNDNPELLGIFREELRERAGRLVDGGRSLMFGVDCESLRRDAHTIKGNAMMMGYDDLARTARELEDAWRDLDEGRVSPSHELAERLTHLAASLLAAGYGGKPEATEPDSPEPSNHEPAPPSPGPAAQGAPPPPKAPSTEGSDAQSHPPAQAPPTESAADLVADLGLPDDFGDLTDDGGSDSELGGLVAGVEASVIGEATRVETARLYEVINRAVEARLEAEALHQKIAAGGDRQLTDSAGDLHERLATIQSLALQLASVPLSETTATFQQLARFLARRTNKDLRLHIEGEDLHVDQQVVDALREPLRHLLVNAIDHGIEEPHVRTSLGKPTTGVVEVKASVRNQVLTVEVTDDGRGIDWGRVAEEAVSRGLVSRDFSAEDLTSALIAPGFSTVAEPTELSGDGEGLALAATAADQLRGDLRIHSEPGAGTTVSLNLPVALALQDVTIVGAGGFHWGIPTAAVLGTTRVVDGAAEFADQTVRTISLSALGGGEGGDESVALVVSSRGGLLALLVDRVVGSREVAVKMLGPVLQANPAISGAAVLGGGNFVVTIDAQRLGDQAEGPAEASRVLIVDDSSGVRQLVGATLSAAGFAPTVARDAEEALRLLEEAPFDAFVIDFSMPGSDGVELVTEIRRKNITVPVVMLSGVAQPADQERALAAGVNAYLDKSDIRRGVLIESLDTLLDREGVGR